MYLSRRHGFGVRRREWMWKCFSLASFSVLINGVPKGHFGCSWGLRQGDPLSPLLFLLVVGVLGRLVDRASKVGMIEGFVLGQGEVVVSHMLFADDTIIFCDNSQWQIRMFRCVLRCFEVVSGFRLNLAKSSIIAVGEVPNLSQLTLDLECRQGQLPVTYLGLPLGAKYKQKDVWSPVIDKMRKRLSR